MSSRPRSQKIRDSQVSSASTKRKRTPALTDKAKQAATWLSIINWLHIAKLIVFVGFVIYFVSIFTSSNVNGMLVAYYWMAIGILATLLMASIMVSRNSENAGFWDIFKKAIPFVVPTLFTLAPIVLLIVIFHSVGNLISRDPTLPSAFTTFNYLTFFFIILQTLLLNQFFVNEIHQLRRGEADPNKWVYVVAFVLSTVITLASATELYVIITHFLTDG
jgi:hypothetical protein